MTLFALGINHHLAPVALRERVAFPPERMIEALDSLVQTRQVSEVVILSTCNRTELYGATEVPEALADWLAEWHGIDLPEISAQMFSLSGADAVRHVFRVASGLDSMVLGETQILGQMKQAVRQAEEAGTLGAQLHKLFQKTFSVAKEVRTRTSVGAHTVSMAAAAVELSERIFATVREQNVLFVGAGQMIERAAAHFAACAPARLTVSNRSLERAQALAQNYGGDALALERLPDALGTYDIVVTSTASPEPVIGLAMVERALKARRYRPVVMVDLGVPRDIASEVSTLDDVYLYTVDEIGQVVDAGVEARQKARGDADAIIAGRVDEFLHWVEARSAVPAIRALRDQAETLRQAEMERAQQKLRNGEAPELVLEALSRGLTNKLLHAPLRYLNEADTGQIRSASELVRKLFNIDRGWR
ncbi:glutamyl-tRNA reductase [Niveibacterium terrae]|uniref:glutamyl-tRNA reductase n=1 Tax=Niveibacterium terrae TaxID=3373598 RepID=UPI003A8CCD80